MRMAAAEPARWRSASIARPRRTWPKAASRYQRFYGSVAAWGDYDNDGDLDLALAGAGTAGPTTRLYRNSGGNLSDSGIVLTDLADARLALGRLR